MTDGFAVEVNDVSKRYVTGPGQELAALDCVSLALEAGAFATITGPSGSGKSTLLHLIGAMDHADTGTIHVDGRDITALSPGGQARYRRTIGFVFQRFHLLPALTACENVAAPLLARRTPFDKFARANELIAAVGLAGREHALPSHLSGGEQQRIAIARALINDPGLLLADEPTGNLDSTTGHEILELLLQLQERHGTTVLIATHDPTVAAQANQSIEIKDGHLGR